LLLKIVLSQWHGEAGILGEAGGADKGKNSHDRRKKAGMAARFLNSILKSLAAVDDVMRCGSEFFI
jgi:hypothetical protein